MAKYRMHLPQLDGQPYITDGGLETTLVFHDGLDLPYFAAFDLLKDEAGYNRLYEYFSRYCSMAQTHNTGFVLESVTWRASADWAEKMGYSENELAVLNKKAIELLVDVRNEFESEQTKMPISACIGPRGDGYNPDAFMSEAEAERYHSSQINTFSETDADMVSAFTMTYAEEAIGIVRAAKAAGMPVVISFTLETDGRLPSGQRLKDAIEQVDTATDSTPSYYMINCAHPSHFEHTLASDASWLQRIQGVRANASSCSHAELDEAEELDDGNPEELGLQYRQLRERLANLNVMGGCCGTDHRHVEAICKACAA